MSADLGHRKSSARNEYEYIIHLTQQGFIYPEASDAFSNKSVNNFSIQSNLLLNVHITNVVVHYSINSK
jgi:hypothetical protein